jgi:hypothetical protein
MTKEYKVTGRDVIILAVILVIFIVAVVLIQARRNQDYVRLNKNFRYTVGVTTGKVKNIRMALPTINYSFEVKGETFIDHKNTADGSIDANGGLYLVKFETENPKNNSIMFDHPVSEKFRVPPDDGWTDIPQENH